MSGTLYAHLFDTGLFLLVRKDRSFPEGIYKLHEWRVVAVGVEPMRDQARMRIRDRGYFAYRAARA